MRRSVSGSWPGERSRTRSAAARELKPQGINTILTALGEDLTQADEAEEVTQHYLDVFDKVPPAGSTRRFRSSRRSSASISTRRCASATSIACSSGPSERNNFLWIDMEYSRYVDPTLELFRRARAKSARIGIALQAYLYRTAKDVEALIPLGPAIRIVKGAYLEPAGDRLPEEDRTSTRTSTRCACG